MIRDKVAIVGVGETQYCRRGEASDSEFVLACRAIRAAAADAGIPVDAIDGFASYGDDRNDSVRIAAALGMRDIGPSTMVWGGGGGGVCAAVGNAAAMLVAGSARYAVVYRALAQGQFARYGAAPQIPTVSGTGAYMLPYGISTPAQTIALRTMRFMHEAGVKRDALAAVALSAYAHAQRNPRAVMHGRPLTREMYDDARMIAEPFCLYDCCMENDGAAAMILTVADRAPDAPRLLAVAQGSTAGYSLFGTRPRDYATANFRSVAPKLWAQAGVGPSDVDVAGIYENFTGAVVMSLVEHGFCSPDEVMDFCTVENFSFDGGGLPLNTSGGNLAECYMHGLELVIECVRQLRGTSTAQVTEAKIAMVAGGPVTAPVSSLVMSR